MPLGLWDSNLLLPLPLAIWPYLPTHNNHGHALIRVVFVQVRVSVPRCVMPDCLNMCGPCEQYSSIPRLHKISFYLALCIAIRRFHGQTKPKSAHTQLAVGKRFCRTSLIYSHRHILLHCDIVLYQCSSNWSVLPAVHATAQLCHYYTTHVYCYPIQYLLHRQHQTVKEERTIGWQTNKKQTNKTKL